MDALSQLARFADTHKNTLNALIDPATGKNINASDRLNEILKGTSNPKEKLIAYVDQLLQFREICRQKIDQAVLAPMLKELAQEVRTPTQRSSPESKGTPTSAAEKTASEQYFERFEQILNGIDVAGKIKFREFMEKEFSVENLNFYEAVQKFKTLPVEERPDRAREIIDTYIRQKSESQVNLPTKIRQPLEGGAVSRDMFDAAAAEIFKLMFRDSVGRFMKTLNR